MKLKNDNGIPLYIPFKQFYGKEIKDIAKYSCMHPDINLSKFLINGNELYMHGSTINIIFTHVDNSKPLFYNELVFDEDFTQGKLVSKRFDEKFKTTSYKFPYYEFIKPEKLVASKTESNLFGATTVLEYTTVKESIGREINYDKVEEIIYEVLEKYNAFTYKN